MQKKILCRTIDGGTKEVNADELSFRPSVYGVAIKDDKVLLVPQFDGYDFPGGGIDINELMDDALVREVKEETGLDCKKGDVLNITDSFFFHPMRKQAFHSPLIYFSIEIIGGEISTSGFDTHEKEYAKKAEWVPIEKALTTKFETPADGPALIKAAIKIKSEK